MTTRTQPDIWRFQALVTRRLLWWAAANIAAGAWLQQRQSKFLRGVGMQSLSWGGINALIALIGGGFTRIRHANNPDPTAPEIVQRERRNLGAALWINAGLDVFYILGGIALALTRGKRNPLMRGAGWGVVIQGGFLFVFDLVHALILSDKDSSSAETS